eukprot:1121719-Karenia_brevis.AAC.1
MVGSSTGLFTTTTTTTQQSRGRAYGYTTNIGQTGTLPVLNNAIEQSLNKAMLGLTSSLTRRMVRDFNNGGLQIRPRPFTGFAMMKCRFQLKLLK